MNHDTFLFERSRQLSTLRMVALAFLMISTSHRCGAEEHPTGTQPSNEPLLHWRATQPKLVHVAQGEGAVPSIIRLRDGTLLASVECKAVENATTVLFIESSNGGATWTEPFASKVPIPKLSPNDVAMGRMNDGRIFIVGTESRGENLGSNLQDKEQPLPKLKKFTRKLPDGRELQVYENYRIRTALWITYSSDRGRKWSTRQQIGYVPLLGAWNWTGGRPVQLKDGTIVVPVSGYLSMEDMDGIWLSSGVLRSRDLGKTWKYHNAAQADKEKGLMFSEPAMARLQDGRLVMMIRTKSRILNETVKSGYRKGAGIYHTISSDGGMTWSPPAKVLPGTHGSIVQLDDGQLLCGWHRPAQFALSSDAGKSWSQPELWFLGKDSHRGVYTNVEKVDGETVMVMVQDESNRKRIWACRLHLVQQPTSQ